MRRILLGLVLVCVAGAAYAQSGGSAGNPLYTRKSQGNQRDQIQVSCTAAGDVALLTSAQTANALSIYCQSMSYNTSQYVGICPRLAAAGACDSDAKFAFRLKGGDGVTIDTSAPGDWSCNGIGYAVPVNCYIERYYRQDTGGMPTPARATPTPIPTQTAGQTPTPRPT